MRLMSLVKELSLIPRPSTNILMSLLYFLLGFRPLIGALDVLLNGNPRCQTDVWQAILTLAEK